MNAWVMAGISKAFRRLDWKSSEIWTGKALVSLFFFFFHIFPTMMRNAGARVARLYEMSCYAFNTSNYDQIFFSSE